METKEIRTSTGILTPVYDKHSKRGGVIGD